MLSPELKARRSEVQKQSDFDVCGRKVIDELHFVGGGKSCYSLYFDDYDLVYHHVGDEISNGNSVIEDRNWFLNHHSQICFGQLVLKRVLINGFKKAWAEGTVNLHRAADNLFRQRVVLHHWSDGKLTEANTIFNPVNPVNPV